jgi:hypothetical protein
MIRIKFKTKQDQINGFYECNSTLFLIVMKMECGLLNVPPFPDV